MTSTEDDSGTVLARRRLPEGLAGITALHELVAEHLDPAGEPDQVLVGIETERGPWVQALLAAGYIAYPINPMQLARYRERHSTFRGESDPADAHVLAEIVRLDRSHHRRIAGDSEVAEHVKVATRAHQTMISADWRTGSTTPHGTPAEQLSGLSAPPLYRTRISTKVPIRLDPPTRVAASLTSLPIGAGVP